VVEQRSYLKTRDQYCWRVMSQVEQKSEHTEPFRKAKKFRFYSNEWEDIEGF
jgi:hypothetical protein